MTQSAPSTPVGSNIGFGYICSMIASVAIGVAIMDLGYNGFGSFDPIVLIVVGFGLYLVDLTIFPSDEPTQILSKVFYDPGSPNFIKRDPMFGIMIFVLAVVVLLKLNDINSSFFGISVDKARDQVLSQGIRETGRVIKKYNGTVNGLNGHILLVRFYDPSHTMHEKEFNVNMIKYLRVRVGQEIKLHYMSQNPDDFVLDNFENENYIEFLYLLIYILAAWAGWSYLKSLIEFWLST